MSGYVYLIGTSVFGWYKIGKSKTPEVRIKDLGILLPFKIRVFRVWKAVDHSRMERALHEMYAANKINGEWFQFTKIQLKVLFDKIPDETLVFGNDALDHFSNIQEDSRQAEGSNYSGKVLGVKIQKLRGDFTPEEREQKRLESMEKRRLKKAEKIEKHVNI